jgi:peptidoglycan/LPS O-acetylase OafA/YrhL
MASAPSPVAGNVARAWSSQARIPELDGLRGVAILLVVLYHYVALSGGAAPGTALYAFQQHFAIGWAGVDLFFVLSGFLIGGILLDARSSGTYFSTFYARRVFRIMPLYYFWIALYFMFVLGPFRSLSALLAHNSEHWSDVPLYVLFAQNSVKIIHGDFGTAWLGPLWSLAVEEQFYLVMPLLVRFVPIRRLVPLLFALLIAAPITRMLAILGGHHAAQYLLTPCRADALSLGVLVAIAWRNERWKCLFARHRTVFYFAFAVLSFAVLYLAIWKPSQYSWTMAVWGFSAVDEFMAGLLIIALIAPRGLLGTICRWGFLVEIGRISYCLYIVHEAVNLLLHVALLHKIPDFGNWRSIVLTLLAALTSIGIARMSWVFLEQPILRHARRFRFMPSPSASTTESAKILRGVEPLLSRR